MSEGCPSIVIMAHDRLVCLERLFSSIARADFTGCKRVDLVISIDGGAREEVREAAERMQWNVGPKTIIRHDVNLGLRDHALFCGDLTESHEAIILLEDDCYVSRAFYKFGAQALRFYQGHNDIAGISLYAPEINESALLPFVPIEDDSDVYFMQLSNLTAAWDRGMWKGFRDWYRDCDKRLATENGLPANMIRWPDSSWKKFATQYLLIHNKFYVYPRRSLMTDFADKGVHFVKTSNSYQVQLDISREQVPVQNASRFLLRL